MLRRATRTIPIFITRTLLNRSFGRSHHTFNRCSSLFTNSDSDTQLNSMASYHLTRATKVNAQRERYLNMTLTEKRKLYHNGHIELEEVETWPIYAAMKKLRAGSADSSKYEVDENLNEKVSIWRGDITKLEIDAIVNAANQSLMGGGGVDGCIHRAAGHSLVQECGTLGGCPTGEAKTTCGYKLPAKYVIHTVGPMGQNSDMLRSCYNRCFQEALDHEIRTVAFPCIATGVYGYPNDRASVVALETTRKWLEKNGDQIDRVMFCLFLDVDVKLYEKFMFDYFPLG